MGLDMYLKADVYMPAYEHNTEAQRRQVRDVIRSTGLRADMLDDSSPSIEVSITCACWRKANQIHKWFVDNVQNGVDECRPHLVSREDLTTLRDLCVEAITTKSADKLPPQDGFFFGGTDVDEYYWEDLEYTRDRLTWLLDNIPDDKVDFTYQSSW